MTSCSDGLCDLSCECAQRLFDDNAYSVSFLMLIHLVNIGSNVAIELGLIVRLESASPKPTLADRAVLSMGVKVKLKRYWHM